MASLRGGIKNCFFLLLVKKFRPPPPPPFLTASVFSDKDFLDLPRPPPPFSQNQSKKSEYFLIRIFCIRRDPPPIWQKVKKNSFFLCLPLSSLSLYLSSYHHVIKSSLLFSRKFWHDPFTKAVPPVFAKGWGHQHWHSGKNRILEIFHMIRFQPKKTYVGEKLVKQASKDQGCRF